MVRGKFWKTTDPIFFRSTRRTNRFWHLHQTLKKTNLYERKHITFTRDVSWKHNFLMTTEEASHEDDNAAALFFLPNRNKRDWISISSTFILVCIYSLLLLLNLYQLFSPSIRHCRAAHSSILNASPLSPLGPIFKWFREVIFHSQKYYAHSPPLDLLTARLLPRKKNTMRVLNLIRHAALVSFFNDDLSATWKHKRKKKFGKYDSE